MTAVNEYNIKRIGRIFGGVGSNGIKTVSFN